MLAAIRPSNNLHAVIIFMQPAKVRTHAAHEKVINQMVDAPAIIVSNDTVLSCHLQGIASMLSIYVRDVILCIRVGRVEVLGRRNYDARMAWLLTRSDETCKINDFITIAMYQVFQLHFIGKQ